MVYSRWRRRRVVRFPGCNGGRQATSLSQRERDRMRAPASATDWARRPTGPSPQPSPSGRGRLRVRGVAATREEDPLGTDWAEDRKPVSVGITEVGGPFGAGGVVRRAIERDAAFAQRVKCRLDIIDLEHDFGRAHDSLRASSVQVAEPELHATGIQEGPALTRLVEVTFEGPAEPVPLNAQQALDVHRTLDGDPGPGEPTADHHGTAGSGVFTAAGKRSQVSA